MSSLNSYLAVYSKLIYGELHPTVQARQTWPNSGGGGLQRASQDSTKWGVAIIFLLFTR